MHKVYSYLKGFLNHLLWGYGEGDVFRCAYYTIDGDGFGDETKYGTTYGCGYGHGDGDGPDKLLEVFIFEAK